MSLSSLKSDSCSYSEKLRTSVGPGMYMLGTPGNDEVMPCSKDIPADPYMRYQHWGAGACAPGSSVDDGSELRGLPYKLSKCSSDAYIPGKYMQKPACNAPGKSDPRACMAPTEDTRLSNPPCTLKSTGWNRWEWLCFDPQEKAIIPFEWNINSSTVMKDNHVPCIETPLDQDGFIPENRHQQRATDGSFKEGFSSACGGAAAPGYPFNAGFTTCANMREL